MAHFVFSNPTSGTGDWSAVTTVQPTWMTALDRQLFKAINGDEGGSWAPSSVITIGGSGLTVTGPCSLSNCNGIFLNSAQTFEASNGSTILLDSGGLLSITSGANAQIQSGATLEVKAGGIFKLDGTVDVTYGTARTVTRSGVELLGTTAGGGTNFYNYSTTPDAWMTDIAATGGPPSLYPVVATKQLITFTSQQFQLKLPRPIHGATLTSVAIVSYDPNGGDPTPTTWPTYLVARVDNGGATSSLRVAGAVTDHHLTSGFAWTAKDTTTFTPDQNNVIDLGSYEYFINVTLPAAASPGAMAVITAVIATYSVPALVPG